MEKIKWAIFDMGGVMASPAGNFARTLIANAYGLTEDEIKHVYARRLDELARGFEETKFWQGLSSDLNMELPTDTFNLLRTAAYKTDAYPEMYELLKKIKTLQIKTAVLTNIIEAWATIQHELGRYAEFDRKFLSYEMRLSKPDREIYQQVLDLLGVAPEECLFVDDFEANLTVPRTLGMTCVWAQNPKQVIGEVCEILSMGLQISSNGQILASSVRV